MDDLEHLASEKPTPASSSSSSTSAEVVKSIKRLEIQYPDKDDPVIVDVVQCDTQSPEHTHPFGGKCKVCDEEHHIPVNHKAVEEAAKLQAELVAEKERLTEKFSNEERIEQQRIDELPVQYDTDRRAKSDAEAKLKRNKTANAKAVSNLDHLKMLGVLICKKKDSDEEVILYASSTSQKLTISDREFCPPLEPSADTLETQALVAKISDYRNVLKEIKQAKGGLNRDFDTAAPLLVSKIEKISPEIHQTLGTTENREQLTQITARITGETQILEGNLQEIRANSRMIGNKKISDCRVKLYDEQETTGQLGSCAAPKLIAQALSQDLEIISIAEFWWDDPVEGGKYPRDKKDLVESCEYCHSFLGNVLCPKQ